MLLTMGVPSSQTASSDEPPPGFVLWTPERLAETIERLDREIGDKSLVFEAYGNYDGHSVYLVLRGKTSPAELHETEADLYLVRRGRATLVVGGELVDAKQQARKQQRGASIRGGYRREIGPGDVIHIPVAVPHQLIVPEGETFLYDLTKFDEEPLAQQ
jgi:mannose-6-phosphate isomerase-like protein (cupin superfamily)